MASIAAASRTSTACSQSPRSRSASAASGRLARTKSASGPTTASPNRARSFSSAWAAGASPTRSRSSSASASRRAVSCAKASSVWRRMARPRVSCSFNSATRRRARSNSSAACTVARAWAAARCARELACAVAACSAASRAVRSCAACPSSVQLGPLPLQRRALPLERPELLDATQQAFFQLAHRGALRQQALPHLLLARAPTRQLGLNGRRVALGRLALGRGGGALPLRLRRPRLFLLAALPRRDPPLPRVAQPLGREREIALPSPDVDLRVGAASLQLGAACLGPVPRLRLCLARPLGLRQTSPLGRQRRGQFRAALAQAAQRDLEVLELAPYQRQRDPETLLDHLAVPLRL